jgi:arabinogalactan endo-1,4-beta-galactosidase
MKLGVDLGTYNEEKAAGARYFVAGQAVDPLAAFRANGVSLFRCRLWVRPFDGEGHSYSGGASSLAETLALAKKAASLGYAITLDLHYSDFWCDPGKQTKPAAWKDLSFAALESQVAAYTTEVLEAFKTAGVPLESLQIGNEITNGFLWPEGQLAGEVPARTNYERFLLLLSAGLLAAREANPETQLILHLEKSGSRETYQEFFDRVEAAHLPFDIIGLSYYPFWHGGFDQLFGNIDFLEKRYGKEIRIMELGYPFTLEDYSQAPGELVINARTVREAPYALPYPLTKEGQAAFVRDFLAEARRHRVAAVYYWEPCWIPGPGILWGSEAGQRYLHLAPPKPSRNEWANQCLFDYAGKALPAFAYFHEID